jgi:hypothetical protein
MKAKKRKLQEAVISISSDEEDKISYKKVKKIHTEKVIEKKVDIKETPKNELTKIFDKYKTKDEEGEVNFIPNFFGY